MNNELASAWLADIKRDVISHSDLYGKYPGQLNEALDLACAALRRTAEYDKAREEGRLVVLPCKVGDTVWTNFAMSGWYFRDKDKPYAAKVVFVGLNDSEEMGGGLLNIVYGKHDHMMQFGFSDIGKTVFLTRQEAEAALSEKEITK